MQFAGEFHEIGQFLHSDPVSLISSYAGSVILKVIYGYQTASHDDRFLVLIEKVMSIFSQASQPGAWLVDIIPWSMYRALLLSLLVFKTHSIQYVTFRTGFLVQNSNALLPTGNAFIRMS